MDHLTHIRKMNWMLRSTSQLANLTPDSTLANRVVWDLDRFDTKRRMELQRSGDFAIAYLAAFGIMNTDSDRCDRLSDRDRQFRLIRFGEVLGDFAVPRKYG